MVIFSLLHHLVSRVAATDSSIAKSPFILGTWKWSRCNLGKDKGYRSLCFFSFPTWLWRYQLLESDMQQWWTLFYESERVDWSFCAGPAHCHSRQEWVASQPCQLRHLSMCFSPMMGPVKGQMTIFFSHTLLQFYLFQLISFVNLSLLH